MSRYLRAVADELNRSCDVLDRKIDDKIGYFDEINKAYIAPET